VGGGGRGGEQRVFQERFQNLGKERKLSQQHTKSNYIEGKKATGGGRQEGRTEDG